MKKSLILAWLVVSNLLASAADFVAHEWGTFTSVQGADGVQIEWNPLITTDLPKFVYDRNRPDGTVRRQPLREYIGKGAFVSLQRMETPVIYFYAEQKVTVDVNVRFPQGIVTEWYPQIAPTTHRHTRWDKVAILPQQKDPSLLPNDGSKTHYYAARQTDAAILAVPTRDQKIEHEKFLFYRGVGSFRAPLQVTMGANQDYVQLRNTENDELRHLFVLSIRGDFARLVRVDNLRGGENKNVKLPRVERTASEVQSDIANQIREALITEGLYGPEAAAMVETWRDSWFGEQGLRVLYVLPRSWTDRILPLSIQPQPRELIRVMVGRAEIITPSMEWELMKQIVKFSEGDPLAVTNVQALGIGRFADAAVRRMLGRTAHPDFSRAAWNLLDTALRQPASQPNLAAK